MKHSLRAFCVPATVLGTWDMMYDTAVFLLLSSLSSVRAQEVN